MKARVNSKLCVRTGNCEHFCPEVFTLERTSTKVRVAVVPHECEEACRKAQKSCPTGAITIEET